MNILLVTPAAAGTVLGNRVTAERWLEILTELGHEVMLATEWRGEPCHLLIAIHARKSYPSVARIRALRPETPVVVALAGTDLYQDLPAGNSEARHALELADRIVVLQEAALAELPPEFRAKAWVIAQSAATAAKPMAKSAELFEVASLAHLRSVKDPLLAARAARRLPAASRLVVLHAGAVLDATLGAAAEEENKTNPRWRFLGELPHPKALELLARARLLVVTSQLEGGANVVSEALAAGVPVLSTHISGSIGQLGEDYHGFFPVGDAEALATLLHRAETDPVFLADLAARCDERRARFSREAEREAWRRLLAETTGLHLQSPPTPQSVT